MEWVKNELYRKVGDNNMHNTSLTFKEKIKESTRQFNARITIGNKVFNNEDIQEISIKNKLCSGDTFSIGSTTSQVLNLTLFNTTDFIFATSQINIEIGLNIGEKYEYVQMGIFNIDELKKTDKLINITAYDNMIKFEKPYFSNLQYPATLMQIANEVASITGVAFTGTLPSYSLSKLEGYTCREMFGYIASLCGGNGKITRDGKFTIVEPKITNLTYTGDNYFNLEVEETPYTIKKISCQVGENVITKGSITTEARELTFENPWMTESILNNIFNKLNGFTYTGFKLKWQGDISLDVWDIVSLTDIKNNVWSFPLLEINLSFKGGIISEVNAKGENKNKNTFNSSGSINKKVDRVVTEQAVINEALINKANIEDLIATNAKVENLEVANATIENLLAGNITAENISAELLKVIKGWMLEASIGNAQISDLDVSKLNAGTIDCSKIGIQSVDGEISIEGYQILINDTADPLNKKNRIILGKYEKAPGIYEYGLVIRGADGKTVMWDENGVHNAGITNGAIDNNKISDTANIDGKKLDINSVLRTINEDGTILIQGTKVQVGNKTLEVVLSERTQFETETTKKLNTQQASIEANQNAIKLKVDTQTYSEDKTNIEGKITKVTSSLNQATSDIGVLKGQISLKVEQTDIDKTKNEILDEIDKSIENVATETDEKISQAKSDIKLETDKIALNVSNLTTKTNTLETQLGDKATKAEVKKVSDKAASIESSLDSITQRVSNVENKTTTIDGEVKEQETRLEAAEQKITPTAITATISSAINSGEGNIDTTQFTMDKTGFTVKNGAIKVQNKVGDDVLKADVNGNLQFTGRFDNINKGNRVSINNGMVYAYTNNILNFSLGNNNLIMYDYYDTSKETQVGRLTSSRNNLTGNLGVALLSNKDKEIVIGYSTSDTSHNIMMRFNKDMNYGVQYPINVFENMYFWDNRSLGLGRNSDIGGSSYFQGRDGVLMLKLPVDKKGRGIWIDNNYTGQNFMYFTEGTTYRAWIEPSCYVNGNLYANGNISCAGSKTRVVDTEHYNRLRLNAYETADCLFADYGSGVIGEDGTCFISLDDKLLETINTNRNYQIFLTAIDKEDKFEDIKLKVIRKEHNYFVVKGNIGLEFDWNIVAKQQNYEEDRLVEHDRAVLMDTDDTLKFNLLSNEESKDNVRDIEKMLEEKVITTENILLNY